MKQIKKTNAGVRFQGNWDEVVLFSHVLGKYLEETAPHRESVDKYEEWIPGEDDGQEDIKEKSAVDACIKPTKVEEEFNGVHYELKDAEHKLVDSVHDIANRKSPAKELSEATKDIERLVAAESIISLRKLEKSIYKHIMLKFNPYYFDTEDFSVNLECKNKERYALTINILDEELRKKVQDRFK
ncbi:MAG: DUF5828 family protein [Thermoplasmatota archaeon]